ncbi:MAG: diphthine--ammonia ligase [Armatimonadota bacterium]|nr:diphthine--ammonia ligase [Armatimonadota bacterium]MDW8156397.1 diphthine--ammonia ligase [Armatimonadota bacterium]
MAVAYALFWSGGKDSTFALHQARESRLDVRYLVNIYEGSTGRVRFHGVRAGLVAAQAATLGIPLIQRHTHPDPFESVFEQVLDELRGRGVEGVLFGNVHLRDVRAWYETRTMRRGFVHREPLWGRPPGKVVRDFLAAGYRAVVTSVDLARGQAWWVGRELDRGLVEAVEASGADPCGEFGEYHTFVFDGPGFQHPVRFRPGESVERDGHRFVDLLEDGA